MSAKSIEAGRAFVRISARDELTRQLKSIQKRMSAFGASVRTIGTRVALAGAGIMAPLGVALTQFAKAGDELDKMSQRTGVAVESLSSLGFAAEQSGADLAAVETGLKGMQRTLLNAEQGLSSATDSLDELGLAASDLSGKSPEAQFRLLADRIAGVEDPSKKAALAMRVFGRAGQQLIPLLNQGSSGISQLQDEAGRLGRQMSTSDATAAAEFADAWNRVKSSVMGVAMQIGAALAPTITKLSKYVSDAAAWLSQFIANNRQTVVIVAAVGAGLLAFGAALVAAGITISLVSTALGGLITLLGVVKGLVVGIAAILTGPFALIPIVIGAVAAVAAVAAAKAGLLGEAWDRAKTVMKAAIAIAKEVFDGVRNALAGGDLLLAVKIAWAGIKVAFFSAMNAIISNMDKAWETMFDAGKRFFKSLLSMVWDSATLIPRLIASALTGGEVQDVLASVFAGATLDIGSAVENKMNDAKDELASLRREAEQVAASSNRDAQRQQAQQGGADVSPDFDIASGESASDKIAERIQSLREEVEVMKLGRDAAERLKLARMGATASELAALKAAQEHKNAIEANEQALRDAREERERETEDLKRRAEDLNRAMRSPFEVFREEVAELKKLRQFGLTDDAFRQAFDDARERLRDATQDTGDRVDTLANAGTFSGFAALRNAGDSTQDRIAVATEETRDAVLEGNRQLAKIGPPKFRR